MIANTFIKRPVTAIVISIVLSISGIICIFNLAIDQYPNITPPSVGVSGSYTGADAQTVEQTVVTPIEEQVNGTPGMEYMQSTSTNTGGASISVTFNVGTNIHIAAFKCTKPGWYCRSFITCCCKPAWYDSACQEPKYAHAGSHFLTERKS